MNIFNKEYLLRKFFIMMITLIISIIDIEKANTQSTNLDSDKNIAKKTGTKVTKEQLHRLAKSKSNIKKEISSYEKLVHDLESTINRNEKAGGKFKNIPEIKTVVRSPPELLGRNADGSFRIKLLEWFKSGEHFTRVSDAQLSIIDDYLKGYFDKEIKDAGGLKEKPTWSIARLYEFIDDHIGNDTKILKSNLKKARKYLEEQKRKLKNFDEEYGTILAVAQSIPNICTCFDFCAAQPSAEAKSWCTQNREEDWCNKMIDARIEKFFEGSIPALRQEIKDRNKKVFREVCRGN